MKFYDEELKILYLCTDCNFDSISSISFDLTSEYSNKYEIESNFTFNIENICETKNITNNGKNNFGATMDQKPFEIERFFICTHSLLILLIFYFS